MIGQMKSIDFGDHLGSKIRGGILGGIKSIFEPKWSPILMYGYNYSAIRTTPTFIHSHNF